MDIMLLEKVAQVPAIDPQQRSRTGLHAVGCPSRFQNDLSFSEFEAFFEGVRLNDEDGFANTLHESLENLMIAD